MREGDEDGWMDLPLKSVRWQESTMRLHETSLDITSHSQHDILKLSLVLNELEIFIQLIMRENRWWGETNFVCSLFHFFKCSFDVREVHTVFRSVLEEGTKKKAITRNSCKLEKDCNEYEVGRIYVRWTGTTRRSLNFAPQVIAISSNERANSGNESVRVVKSFTDTP